MGERFVAAGPANPRKNIAQRIAREARAADLDAQTQEAATTRSRAGQPRAAEVAVVTDRARFEQKRDQYTKGIQDLHTFFLWRDSADMEVRPLADTALRNTTERAIQDTVALRKELSPVSEAQINRIQNGVRGFVTLAAAEMDPRDAEAVAELYITLVNVEIPRLLAVDTRTQQQKTAQRSRAA